MSYVYGEEEGRLPEYSGRGRVKHSDVEYLVEHIVNNRAEILNRFASDGWRLVAADNGICYFERPCFHLYEETDDQFIRIKPGQNS
jgi:hypothetical protein